MCGITGFATCIPSDRLAHAAIAQDRGLRSTGGEPAVHGEDGLALAIKAAVSRNAQPVPEFDLDGSGRLYVQLTDCDIERVDVDLPVALSLRRYHQGFGMKNYFWKAKPLG